jgi:hypothetical protein
VADSGCSDQEEGKMAIGDRAYLTTVPREAQRLAEENGLGECNWFIRAAEATPYYPDSVREVFVKVADAKALDDGGAES